MIIMKIKLNYLITILIFSNFVFSQVGTATLDPKSTLDINGNISVKTVILVGSNSITNINDGVYISINPQAGDQEFRLPSPILFPGRVYFIRNINNTNTAKLSTAAGLIFAKTTTTGGATEIYMYEGIDGTTKQSNRRSIWLLSDGANWTFFD